MMTIEPQAEAAVAPAPARRKPTTIEFRLLGLWHAVLSGAFIVAWLSADEDTYAMHQAAGYVVLAACAARLIVALLVSEGSPLRLPRPQLRPVRDWLAGSGTEGGARLPRRPLLALAAAVLLAFVAVVAGSGAAADFIPSVEDLHGALGELAPWAVAAHVAVVLALLRRRGGNRSAGRPASPQPRAGAGRAALLCCLLAAGLIGASATAAAGEPAPEAILAGYARQAGAEVPGFNGFSALRGERLYQGPHAGGAAATPACAACHGPDPRLPGRNVKTGRPIQPMAVSANPGRFTDAADVEKRFARDCPNVLGRACTAQEKGDFITFLTSR